MGKIRINRRIGLWFGHGTRGISVVYKFGPTSKKKLESCDPKLIKVASKAIQLVDFSIISGHRDQEEQDRYYNRGVSKLRFPNSKHNQYPSLAFDFAPYPIKWDDTEQFTYVAGIIMGVALHMGIKLRYGGDWSQDGSMGNETFLDLGHVEIIK